MYVIRETFADWEKQKRPWLRDGYLTDDVFYKPLVFDSISQAQHYINSEASDHVGESTFTRHNTYHLKNSKTEFTWQIVDIRDTDIDPASIKSHGGEWHLNNTPDSMMCSVKVIISSYGQIAFEGYANDCSIELTEYQVDQLKELLRTYT